MIKHILKIIWQQRRANGWIFAELLVVIAAVWTMIDGYWVDLRTYDSPLGYDITNVWRFKLSNLNEKSPAWVPDSLYTSSAPEDLARLMDQIRRHPAVEEVCITYYSCPYSYGNSWMNIKPVAGDTTVASQRSFQVRRVSPGYFDVFRVKDTEGKPVSEAIRGIHNPMVVSRDMAELFFHNVDAKGRKVCVNESEQESTIASVCMPVRVDEYQRSEACYYEILEGAAFNDNVNGFGSSNAELCVRMKKEMTREEMNLLLEDMGDRLTVNNLNVYGVRQISDFRAELLKGRNDAASQKLALMLFLLVNVFFGIIGTFWLRTQNRRGEIGLRVALGSSRLSLKKFLYLEGLVLLMLTLPFELIFAANMIYMDKLDSYRIPLSAVRFLITFGGTYLLMAAMICIGIWFPVRKAVKMQPAEALHYE